MATYQLFSSVCLNLSSAGPTYSLLRLRLYSLWKINTKKRQCDEAGRTLDWEFGELDFDAGFATTSFMTLSKSFLL